MRTIFKYEDFLDFYYNGKWASELGLIRVNNGKRQDDEVLPASKDTTIDVPGNDGMYYVKGKYQQREFKIDFAYDGLTEADIKAIREWLAPKKECRLIFAERPYKYYMAKPKSAPKLSYIAFDANDGSRVYKGEGSVQFVCYYPWARSVAKNELDLQNELVISYDFTDQQLAESGLYSSPDYTPDNGSPIGRGSRLTNNGLEIYNCGQLPSPFKFVFTVVSRNDESKYYNFYLLNIPGKTLILDATKLKVGKSYCIDTENHLITRVENIKTVNGKITYNIEELNGSAVILNEAIVAGDFFDLPANTGTQLVIDIGGDSLNYDATHFLYDWLYY